MICRNCFKKTRASSLKKWLFRVKTLNWPFQMSHINALFFRVYDPFANIRSQHSSSPHLNQYTYIDFTENETFLSISATSRTVRSHAFTHFACEIPHTFSPSSKSSAKNNNNNSTLCIGCVCTPRVWALWVDLGRWRDVVWSVRGFLVRRRLSAKCLQPSILLFTIQLISIYEYARSRANTHAPKEDWVCKRLVFCIYNYYYHSANIYEKRWWPQKNRIHLLERYRVWYHLKLLYG